MESRRVRTYLWLRLAAGVTFLAAALVVPPGLPAALLVILAGIVAVTASFGTNAGARGERAGARMQDRHFNRVMAPQGQWPPYECREGDGD